MTKDDILRMAREVADVTKDSRGREEFCFDDYGLERFATLVATAEREACAEICAEIARKQQTLGRRLAALECHSAIHAKGQK